MEILGSCTAKFNPSKKKCKPRKCKHTAKPVDPTNLAPIEQVDPAFHQPFEICPWQNDIDNNILKDRKFMNPRGQLSFVARPNMQNCLPNKINLERGGDPSSVSIDNKNEVAENLLNIDIDTNLRGIGSFHSFCRNNRDIKPHCSKTSDPYCRRMRSYDIDKNFNDASVNDNFFRKQLYTDYCEEENLNLGRPSVFRNYSKRKLQSS